MNIYYIPDGGTNENRIPGDFDSSSDGSIDTRTTFTQSYDVLGNMLTGMIESDDGLDGTIDGVTNAFWTYDGMNELSETVSSDRDNDGDLDHGWEEINT